MMKQIFTKQALLKALDQQRDRILAIAEAILRNPEVGFREEATSALVRSIFDEFAIPYTFPHALTGVRGCLKGRNSHFRVAIIGEMDALHCSGHPYANGTVAHACGHHAQMAAMLGTAIALKESGVMEHLDGDVIFLAVPAEEFIDLPERQELQDQGKISFLGGKQQLIAEGVMDDIDMAIMIHAQPNCPEAKLFTRSHNLGFRAKSITFYGKAAHGSRPYEGTNALNAAALAILGIHANRETFREEERIRIHPIITRGGDVVNSVPDEVCLETYVRGADAAAIRKGEEAVSRAVNGAADMIGATACIDDIPGYLPLTESVALSAVMEEIYTDLTGMEPIRYSESVGSSDIGDLSSLIPVIQPSIGGFCGNLHGRNFAVSDPDIAYLLPAKLMALTVSALLGDGAKVAEAVKTSFHPVMTKETYLAYLKGDKPCGPKTN